MVSVDKAIVARIAKDHTHFEILVDPDKALEFRKGAKFSMENLLAVAQIFTDSRKGDRASTADLTKHFGTSDVYKVAEQIVKEGEIQLTTEQRRKMLEEKRTQIANIISRHGTDPRTKLPHPPQRILNAMEEVHLNIDPFRPAEQQVQHTLDAIAEILPISIEKVEVALRIPIQYAGRASSVMHNIAPVKKEEWRSDSWIAVIEIPAGMQAEIFSKINDLSAGQAETKILSRRSV
jgi:ribosome maturation protein SDO1